MLVEQAIFTSTQTVRAEGYQLVAASPDLAPDDRRELGIWGPSHDSLVYAAPDAASVNFFPLSSGAYCVSRTLASEGGYSGRGGLRYYTHFLVVPADGFRRFANNPFAILRAATAQGALEPYREIPETLKPLRLTGRCAVVDHGLLTDLIHDPGMHCLTGALAEMLVSPRWALATTASQAPRLIAGLFNCLPIDTRPEFSFTTGLRLSRRRPFRIICLPPDPAEIRRIQHQHGTVFTMAGQPGVTTEFRGWAGYVSDVLRTGRTSVLATSLARSQPVGGLADLDAWGEQLSHELVGGEVRRLDTGLAQGAGCEDRPPEPPGSADHRDDGEQFPRLAQLSTCSAGDNRLDPQPAVSPSEDRVRQRQQRGCHDEAVELLDLLDDAVFDAIAGQEGAVGQLRTLWPQATSRLDHDVLEESKAHYLQHALATWRQCQERESVIDPARGVLMLDVLAILLG